MSGNTQVNAREPSLTPVLQSILQRETWLLCELPASKDAAAIDSKLPADEIRSCQKPD